MLLEKQASILMQEIRTSRSHYFFRSSHREKSGPYLGSHWSNHPIRGRKTCPTHFYSHLHAPSRSYWVLSWMCRHIPSCHNFGSVKRHSVEKILKKSYLDQTLRPENLFNGSFYRFVGLFWLCDLAWKSSILLNKICSIGQIFFIVFQYQVSEIRFWVHFGSI